MHQAASLFKFITLDINLYICNITALVNILRHSAAALIRWSFPN